MPSSHASSGNSNSTDNAAALIGLRLNQALAQSGLCSRKAAARLISELRVTVNGKQQPHHYQVKSGDVILLDGKPLPAPAPLQYWRYHKPVGIDCNLNNKKDSLKQLLESLPLRLFPLGRLDKDSCGLLLLSNDGALAQKLMHPSFAHQKTYQVTVDKPLQDLMLHRLAQGLTYQVGPHLYQTLPCQLQPLTEHSFQITLTQGLNRQIRYMCREVGLKVLHLQRTHINQLALGDLAEGQMQQLSKAELQLLQGCAQSTAEPAAS
ncbi:pseudouridine synthase [Rheinheimera sp. 4Y26]|uniref:pseudouridine synthase n=1 Tax=Rheinheimera sp. 4Y26 TaxID=2977811 RepID=UPI0021B115AF|nr:pseudouridine synthase [Rheinheimera sp. 4Y26]MCT6700535.1 rRNA pseudouridine synthase [Rheinheimera sp. 4Y26]